MSALRLNHTRQSLRDAKRSVAKPPKSALLRETAWLGGRDRRGLSAPSAASYLMAMSPFGLWRRAGRSLTYFSNHGGLNNAAKQGSLDHH